MVERIQYVCSLCKYRTYYDDEMTNHLESKFHSDHFSFVGTKLPKLTTEFLQEYVSNKHKKTMERRRSVQDINAAIQQIYRDHDVTKDLGMDHFVKKIQAAHCTACDYFFPMQFGILQQHLKSVEHNQNRKAMMQESKNTALIVAKGILNNKMISKKLERYRKGDNPFINEPREQAGDAEGTEEGLETEGASEDQTGKESINDESALTADEEDRQLDGGDEDGAEAEEEGSEEAEPIE